ncbi:hypothetical protein UlMin_007648 [Ulmus minor]
MGEEKKPEEKKVEEKPVAEEKKKEEKKTEEGKDGKEEAPPPPPPPPQEIILKVYMHCEGCARKVRRCLRGFEGVEDVITDCKTHKVIVKGEKADPLKVQERVQRKSHRQVELLSPIPKPPPAEEKKPEEKPKPEEKKVEVPIVTVVLQVFMHCEACAQEIKKRILRMQGVESAEPDLKSSQVAVKGAFDPPKLVEYVHKRTGKHAVIVKQEPEKKDKEGKEEKKAEGGGEKDKKGGEEAAAPPPPAGGEENKTDKNEAEAGKGGGDVTEETKVELKKNELNYPTINALEMYANNAYPTSNAQEMYANNPYAYHSYPPQIFSDENPNACSVM